MTRAGIYEEGQMKEATKRIVDWLDGILLLIGSPILVYIFRHNINRYWLFLGALILLVFVYWVSEVSKERPKQRFNFGKKTQ